MPEEKRIQIRAMEPADLQAISEIDHSYHTEYVWQMEMIREGDRSGVTFKEVRLPRAMKVEYPRMPWDDLAQAKEGVQAYISTVSNEIGGYIRLDSRQAGGGVWIKDIAVRRRFRRQGIASAMIVRAENYALENGYRRIFLEMQSKNHPGISLAAKLGFEFSGFADQFYANQDIAVFFARRI